MSDELEQHLGADAAAALTQWCAMNEREVRVPADAWRGTGYTEAMVAPLFVTEIGKGSRLALVKILPPRQVPEAAAHRRALHQAPPAFRPHLVGLLGDPIPTPDGGAIMFQELAGGSRDWRPLADLAPDRVADACAVITRSLIDDWNPAFTVQTVREIDLLRGLVDHPRSVGRPPADPSELIDGPWICTGDDDPVPNPRSLLTDERVLGDRRIDIVTGRVHGDLHNQNVLIEQGESRTASDTFRLIDLMTYQESAPLDRDPVTMLLSATAGLLADLSPSQRSLLLGVFVRPEAEVPAALPRLAVAPLQAIYPTAATLLARTGAELWRRQYLLSLVGHGLMFTTFTNLGATHRWWFYRLAARAAGRLLGGQPPADITVVHNNPFADPARQTPTADVPPPSRTRPGRHQYSGQAKMLVCRRLGEDWRDLATYLDIPTHEQARFLRGDEARGIWDWLERRRRLPALALALRTVGRVDLADLLDHDGTYPE